LKINYIDYKENTIPFDTEEGIKIIDKWVDNWGYIFRSLKYRTDYISTDLSGGFDTRTLLSILLNSGVDLNNILVNSIKDKKHDHSIDYEIASKIASKFGFKLNNYNFNNEGTELNLKDTILNTMYTKLGFHKEFYLKNKFYKIPRFAFVGSGGESLRGVPQIPINEFIKKCSSKKIFGHSEEFFNSSMRLLNRSVSFLKKNHIFNNDFEITFLFHSKNMDTYHCGKTAVERFLSNFYSLQPLLDPEIRKIKFDVNANSSHDLIAFIFVRFSYDLTKFPFQGNRTLNIESIKRAQGINSNLKPYKIKTDYNNNFFIDDKRKCPMNSTKENKDPHSYLKKIFSSSEYIKIFCGAYDINVYNWANEYIKKNDYHPLRHHYALLAIVITINNILLNKRNSNNKEHTKSFKETYFVD
jgi:hypothetical protein